MKHLVYKPSSKIHNNIQVCLPFIQSFMNMESAHYNTPIRSKATLLGPRRSTLQRPVEQTWRNTDKSLRVRVLKIFFQQNPEYTNTQQDLPDQWV